MRDELFEFDDFFRKTFNRIIGIDEAGRGCLAGPVVAAAVVLQDKVDVFDSKQLTVRQREGLFEQIMKTSQVGIGLASAEEIDLYNILNATKLAMNRALRMLNQDGFALIDGKSLKLSVQGKCIVKGDTKSASIAAASIVAKVVRDRIMKAYDKVYPGYGFSKHKGYATKEHIQQLKVLGPTVFHRLTFSPVLSLLNYERIHGFLAMYSNSRRYELLLEKIVSSGRKT
ncbi:MAG TPA: ribonuclease HII [Pseudothermotoga sp.]|nr:ribonuclease HII [Pseudothermotoga sp.]HOK83973.1 ribonuclease HII [Pseudothermotoga sp.]HPP70956.1 ribonuclease HII [Pseudothermotoga sp.]